MEIVLGVGFGKLLFGLTETQAQTTLGPPDRSYKPNQVVGEYSLTELCWSFLLNQKMRIY